MIQADGSTNNTLIFLANGNTAFYFDLVNGVYQPRIDDGSQLTNNSSNDTYTLLDTQADQPVERFQYGYNQDSEVLYRDNLLQWNMGELYSYDNVGQLVSFQRGTLNVTHSIIVGSPLRSQSWTPDDLGNFSAVAADSAAEGRGAPAELSPLRWKAYTTHFCFGTIA